MILTQIFYLCSGTCFILALKGLSSPKTAQKGNVLGIIGMVVAILTTLWACGTAKIGFILSALFVGGGIGTLIAQKIQMTALPQMVAAFHSLVGLAAVLVAASTLYLPQVFGLRSPGSMTKVSLVELGIGTIIGSLTFSGSVIAFTKLQGIFKRNNLVLPQHSFLTALASFMCLGLLYFFIQTESYPVFWLMALFAFILGIFLILPIGGSDMPVVVSMLNSYSGWAAAATGFTLNNFLLIITGALVGASGTILSYIMCKNMNRTLRNVLLGSLRAHKNTSVASAVESNKTVKVSSPEDAAFILNNARSVIIIPGYGMAVAQAQHVLCAMGSLLQSRGIQVHYAIHPVAGRMPGHMNVLLAEAKVPYQDVFEIDAINHDFASTDVAFVIGANDITNPAAHNDPNSPIYGMPILNVEKASSVLFVKRSLGTGYAGIDNELFYRDNTMMVLGDAKKVCETLVQSLQKA